MKINSPEYECWHEVGHALVALHFRLRVVVIKEITDSNSIGRWRTECTFSPTHRSSIACGGFAAEYILYKDGKLSATDSEFEAASTKNAQLDILRFFDLDYEYPTIPSTQLQTSTFKYYAIKNIVPILKPQKRTLKKLAKRLAKTKILTEQDIRNAISHKSFWTWISELFKGFQA